MRFKTLLNDKQIRKELLILLIACVIYAISIYIINEANIIPGSFVGIAVSLNKVFGWPTGLVNLLMNIPVMYFVTRKMGVKTLIYTILIMALTSLFIDLLTAVLPPFPLHNGYVLSIIGGIVMGIGAGLLIRIGGTMAGTTALTCLIQRVVKKLSFGTILFTVDSVIILVGALVVKDFKAIIYSVIYSFFCARFMDIVIEYGKKKTD